MNVIETVAAVLKMEGVEWVSCFPSNQLIELVAREGIRTIMFRQERGAIMAADGFSRVNDRKKFGVVITQGGPGAENSMGGIAQAYADNVPILYLPAGPALARYAVRPEFSPVRSYQSVSKRGEVITQPDQVAGVMRRAFHALRNGPPGPVIVEIPRISVGRRSRMGRLVINRPAGRFNALQPTMLRMLSDCSWTPKSRSYGPVWEYCLQDATEELKEFAELTRIPVYCTMPGKSSFDERHPLSLGSGSGGNYLARPAMDTRVRRSLRSRIKYDQDTLWPAHSRGKNHHP